MISKFTYKSVGFVAGAVAGLAVSVIFKQVWRTVSGDDDVPRATDEDRGWTEILIAAAIQGAIFAIVKAAVDRGGANSVKQLTGKWPS